MEKIPGLGHRRGSTRHGSVRHGVAWHGRAGCRRVPFLFARALGVSLGPLCFSLAGAGWGNLDSPVGYFCGKNRQGPPRVPQVPALVQATGVALAVGVIERAFTFRPAK